MTKEQQPRVVAELGRPETPEESAARKAVNSRLYRQRKTINNLVFSLLATVGLAIVIVLVVPRGEVVTQPDVDYAALAVQAQAGIPQRLVVPELGDGWRANAAELREDAGGVDSWYIGLLTPSNDYVGVSQGLDANDTWVAGQVENSAATSTESIDGVEWTVYDNRETSRDVGNVRYAMTASVDSSDFIVFGTASPKEIRETIVSISDQLGETEQTTP